MIGRTLAATVVGLVGFAAVEAAAQTPVEMRAAARVCRIFLLEQATNGGFDVASEEIRLTPAARESSNLFPIEFRVASPSVTASGRCVARGTGNNMHVANVQLNFARAQ